MCVLRIPFCQVPKLKKKHFPEDINGISGAFLLFIAVVICTNLFSLCWWKTEYFHRPHRICSVYRNILAKSNLKRSVLISFQPSAWFWLASHSWGGMPRSAWLAKPSSESSGVRSVWEILNQRGNGCSRQPSRGQLWVPSTRPDLQQH